LAKKIKRICFVQPRAYYLFNPKADNFADKIGGAQKQSYLYSIELAKHKAFDVHFVTADFGQQALEKYKNVSVWKSFNFDDNILKKSVNLLNTLKKINADIYYFRSADIGVALAAFFIKAILNKKIFYSLAHDSETNFYKLMKKSGVLTALTMPYIYKYADILSVQSKTQLNLLLKYRKRKADAVLKNIILHEKQVNVEKKTILWVGRLDPIKKPELFIELAKKYPHEQFIMIAPAVRDYQNYGNKIKNNTSTINNIEYIKYVNSKDIINYYQKAKIYILSSDIEGFSNTMAEAMANMIPILSYKVNPDNIFNRYKIGYCAEGNKDKFFEQFESLLNNHSLSEKLGYNGRIYLEKNHNKEKTVNEFIKLLGINK
jgi:glycosyltransferase involved in cell wall biosynthesis